MLNNTLLCVSNVWITIWQWAFFRSTDIFTYTFVDWKLNTLRIAIMNVSESVFSLRNDAMLRHISWLLFFFFGWGGVNKLESNYFAADIISKFSTETMSEKRLSRKHQGFFILLLNQMTNSKKKVSYYIKNHQENEGKFWYFWCSLLTVMIVLS